MGYQKQNFANGNVLTAENLNHIENGIADVESTANATKGVVDKIIDPTLSISGKAADAAKVGEAVNAETTRAKAAEEKNAKGVSQLKEDVFGINDKTILFDIPYYTVSGAIDITRDVWVKTEISTFIFAKKGEVYEIKTTSNGACSIYFTKKMQYSAEEKVEYYSKMTAKENSISLVVSPENCYLYISAGRNADNKTIDWIKSSKSVLSQESIYFTENFVNFPVTTGAVDISTTPLSWNATTEVYSAWIPVSYGETYKIKCLKKTGVFFTDKKYTISHDPMTIYDRAETIPDQEITVCVPINAAYMSVTAGENKNGIPYIKKLVSHTTFTEELVNFPVTTGAVDISTTPLSWNATTEVYSAWIPVSYGETYKIKCLKKTGVFFTDKKYTISHDPMTIYDRAETIPDQEITVCVPINAAYMSVTAGEDANGIKYVKKIISGTSKNETTSNDPLNYGAVYDGVTDCTNAINIALSKGGSIYFNGSGTALCSGPLLISKSNTHIYIDSGFTIKLKDNSNHQLIKTPSCDYAANDSAVYSNILDNISIIGGTFDLNGNNQTRNSNWWITNSGVQLADCTNLNIENVRFVNATAFTLHLGNVKQFSLRNIHIDNGGRGLDSGSFNNTDGIHFSGDTIDGFVQNVHGICDDDLIGVNCAGDQSAESVLPLRIGNCVNLTLRNIYSDDSSKKTTRAIRLMSLDGYKFDNIVVDGVYGEYRYIAPILISGYNIGGAKYGKIVLKNINASSTYSLAGKQNTPIIMLGHEFDIREYPSSIESLIIDGVQIHNTSEHINNLLLVQGQFTAKSISISNIHLDTDNVDNSAISFIHTTGTIEVLQLSNIIIQKPTTSGKINFLFDGNVKTAMLSNVFCAVTGVGNADVIAKSNVIET